MRAPARTEVVVNGSTSGLASATIRAGVESVLRRERRTARIELTFLGKSRMRRLNATTLGHDYPTDVITFPLPQPDGSLAADIFICRYVAARNAREHGSTVRTELLRLIVHGTLHALGYDHPSGATRTRSTMWRLQEKYLAGLA